MENFIYVQLRSVKLHVPSDVTKMISFTGCIKNVSCPVSSFLFKNNRFDLKTASFPVTWQIWHIDE